MTNSVVREAFAAGPCLRARGSGRLLNVLVGIGVGTGIGIGIDVVGRVRVGMWRYGVFRELVE